MYGNGLKIRDSLPIDTFCTTKINWRNAVSAQSMTSQSVDHRHIITIILYYMTMVLTYQKQLQIDKDHQPEKHFLSNLIPLISAPV